MPLGYRLKIQSAQQPSRNMAAYTQTHGTIKNTLVF
jgi:hypothetical protein